MDPVIHSDIQTKWLEVINFTTKGIPEVDAARAKGYAAGAAYSTALQNLRTAERSRKPGKEERIAAQQALVDLASAAAQSAREALEALEEPYETKMEAQAKAVALQIAEAFLYERGWNNRYVNLYKTGKTRTMKYSSNGSYDVYVCKIEDEPGEDLVAVTADNLFIQPSRYASKGDLSYDISNLDASQIGKEMETGDGEYGCTVTWERGYRDLPFRLTVRWNGQRSKTVAEARDEIRVHTAAVDLGEFIQNLLGPVAPKPEEK